MKMEVIENGRVVPKNLRNIVLLDASDRFRARQLERRRERAMRRNEGFPERQILIEAGIKPAF